MKYRRTVTMWMMILAPVACTAVAALYVHPQHVSRTAWNDIIDMVNQLWSGIWIPLAAGLTAGLSAHMETGTCGWRSLRARNVSPAYLYLAKLNVLVVQMFLSSLWLTACTIGTAFLIGVSQPIAWSALLTAIVTSWCATLPLLFASYWIAEAIGWAVSIALGIMGILVASIVGATSVGAHIWEFIPWSWPIRLLYQVYGLFVPMTSTRLSCSAVLAVLLAAIVLTFALGWGGIRWFERREVD